MADRPAPGKGGFPFSDEQIARALLAALEETEPEACFMGDVDEAPYYCVLVDGNFNFREVAARLRANLLQCGKRG